MFGRRRHLVLPVKFYMCSSPHGDHTVLQPFWRIELIALQSVTHHLQMTLVSRAHVSNNVERGET